MRRAEAVLFIGAVALGVFLGIERNALHPLAALLGIALIIFLGKKWPEALLVAFVAAGAFKNAVSGSGIPDLTVVLGAALVIVVIDRLMFEGLPRLSLGSGMFGLLVLVVAIGAMGSTPAYGIEKAWRFATLSTLSFIGGAVLLRSERQVLRLIYAVTVVGVVMSLTALAEGGSAQTLGRFTAFEGNTIQLGRFASLAAVSAMILTMNRKGAYWWTMPILGVAIFAMLGSGSRGPLLGLCLALCPLMFVHLARRGASRLTFGLALLGMAGLLYGVWSLLPLQSLYRFELLLHGQPGTSGENRLELYSAALKMFIRSPLVGMGTGSFSLVGWQFSYPHNIVIEVAAETGLAGLFPLVFMLAEGLYRGAKLALSRPGVVSDFLFSGLVMGVVNALISGDLNDNRLLYVFLGCVLGFAWDTSHRKEATQ